MPPEGSGVTGAIPAEQSASQETSPAETGQEGKMGDLKDKPRATCQTCDHWRRDADPTVNGARPCKLDTDPDPAPRTPESSCPDNHKPLAGRVVAGVDLGIGPDRTATTLLERQDDGSFKRLQVDSGWLAGYFSRLPG
jgi:hypothetical protein